VTGDKPFDFGVINGYNGVIPKKFNAVGGKCTDLAGEFVYPIGVDKNALNLYPENNGYRLDQGTKEKVTQSDCNTWPVLCPHVGKYHLGEDWNRGSGNQDLGDPVYAVANGKIIFADDLLGEWGNVVTIEHKLPSGKYGGKIVSQYAHLDNISHAKDIINSGGCVVKGQQIGTIGGAHGVYSAHLHFEIREDVNLPPGGPGYHKLGVSGTGRLHPSDFIGGHDNYQDLRVTIDPQINILLHSN